MPQSRRALARFCSNHCPLPHAVCGGGTAMATSMTILHVTDFHFNKRWFDWLLHRAPFHDLVVMSGDMHDISAVTPQRRQIEWVSDWLNDFPRPIAVCSGNHDLEWDFEAERWTPAYWLRDIVNPFVWADGQRVELNGISFLNIGATTRPKGGDADVWVVHAPPSKTLVATRPGGADAGDPDLAAAVRRYTPRLVFSGHVHTPTHWREHREATLFLNPGRGEDAALPNHILVRTDDMSSRLVCASHEEERTAESAGSVTIGAQDTTATIAVA
jgi:Icc-related predicted phosphoesterase